jgi:hypothetical protein
LLTGGGKDKLFVIFSRSSSWRSTPPPTDGRRAITVTISHGIIARTAGDRQRNWLARIAPLIRVTVGATVRR